MSLLMLLQSAAPVVADNTPGSYTLNTKRMSRTFNPLATISNTTPSGMTSIRTNNPALYYIGLLPGANSYISNRLTAAGKSAYGVTFKFTGQAISIGAKLGHLNLWVNDELQNQTPVDLSSTSIVTYTFANGLSNAEVFIEFGNNTQFSSLSINSGAQISRVATKRKLFVYGDSWIEGASYMTRSDGVKRNAPGMLHMGWLTGFYLDADIYYHGIGGTAYRSGAGVNDYGSDTRLQFVKEVKPDDLLVVGSINSPSDYDGAKLFYNKMHTSLPETKVYVQGRQSYGDSTNRADVSSSDPDLRKAIVDAGTVSGSVFPNLEKWITGTGHSLSGTGDAFLYHNGENPNHLTDAGNDYYAKKSASALIKMMV